MSHVAGQTDQSPLFRSLDPKQRKVLELFSSFETITARQVGELFGFKPRTSAKLCQQWVEEGFLQVANPANRNRRYSLAKKYRSH